MKMMTAKQKFLRSQQNIAAAGIALLFFLASLLVLLGTPRPGMLDTGLYDLVLPRLGLERGSFYPQEALYTQPNEQFVINHLPWDGLLQLTPAPSLVYPAALTSILCSLLHQPFSTVVLAVVLAAGLAAALFVLTKALYALWGSWGVLAGGLWAAALLWGDFLLHFNSLYPAAAFPLMLTAFLAAVCRALALLRLPAHGTVSVWLPAAVTGLLLVTTSEITIFLLLPVGLVVLFLGLRAAAGRPAARRSRKALVLGLALLAVCSLRFAGQNGQVFNRTNLYHSFFDGVLLTTDTPEQVLAGFGLDPQLAQDTGKSAYLSEDSYYISPTGPRAGEIYQHLDYGKIAGYYLRHPSALLRLMTSVLPQAGHLDTSRCVTVAEEPEPAQCADYWDFLRGFLFTSPPAFFLISLCCLLLGLLCLCRRQRGLAGLLCTAGLSGWGTLTAALWGCGNTDIAANLVFFQAFLDLQLCALLVFLAYGVHRAVGFIAYSALSSRTPAEPVFPAECYAPLPVPHPAWLAACKCAIREIVRDSRRCARAAALACLLVMVSVLFFPRIGAYNNGDLGRMMDAMGLVYPPEDYFDPAVQYEKVIENYDYLEPYDWTRIRPGKVQLTQSWISAGMRMLYDTTGIPFSTAVLAVFHLLVLALCVYQLVQAAHRHWGSRPALLGTMLYLLLFCGSYNLGWLNSLFGEGIAFIGLMLVLASSVFTIEHSSAAGRRAGLLLTALASIYLACAKAQYTVFTPVLLVWWLCLALGTAPDKKKKLLSLAAGALVTAFLGVCAVGVYTNDSSISSQDTLYSGLLNGILLYADDPETALQELGLDTGLAADKGKHPYLPKDEYYCPPRTEKAEELIYSKVSSVDYLLWYLRHPKAFWHLLDDTAVASSEAMPDYNLYVGENNTQPHRTVNKFNLWAQVRAGFVPKNFALYVLLFGSICVAAFAVMFRRQVPRQHKLYAGLLVLLIALGAMQYPLPMVGNGHSDPVKQLYFFREVYDMVFLLVVLWLVFRFLPWAARLWQQRAGGFRHTVNQPQPGKG